MKFAFISLAILVSIINAFNLPRCIIGWPISGVRVLSMASREINVKKATSDELATVSVLVWIKIAFLLWRLIDIWITILSPLSQYYRKSWPTWGCGVSKFDWSYDSTETSYIIKGKVTVTPTNGGSPVSLQAGDYVVFPEGMSCVWQVTEPIVKHYSMSY